MMRDPDNRSDCSDLCFDLYRPDPSGDYPIIKAWLGRIDAGQIEWSDLDCGRSQVFGAFSEYLNDLQEWLTYKATAPEFHFSDWLRARGKRIPTKYYGEPC